MNRLAYDVILALPNASAMCRLVITGSWHLHFKLTSHFLLQKIWDELDLWHSKLSELDSEVQDFVEQDPGQAQEWMDNLMAPFQQHQQVSQRAESRTSQLNKVQP